VKVQKRAVEVTAKRYQDAATERLPGLNYITAPVPVGTEAKAIERVTCNTLEGRYDVHDGDWIVYGVKGEPYPVPPEKFTLLYDHIEGDRYRSKPMTRDAIKMPNRFTIHCSGGNLTGDAGDWLMLATPDDAYPVEAAIFERTYDVVEEAP
jgi:hypothetical protein